MKKIFTLLFVLASVFSFGQSSTLVISQLYGAGGNNGAVFDADFVELHNVSPLPVDITGYSIQYASATSTTNWSGKFDLPTAIIPAGGYFLIQMSSAGANGSPLPTPDATALPTIAMASASGKVALVSNTTVLSGCSLSGVGVVDMVGYGSANCSETSPTGTLSSANGAIRNNNGCDDTDNNANDFTIAPPAPRNSTASTFICSSTPVPIVTATSLSDFGTVNVGSASASQTLTIEGSNLTGFPGVITVTAAPADFEVSLDGTTWSASVTIPYTSATLAPTDVFVRFVPQTSGPISGTITIDGGGGVGGPLIIAVSGTGNVSAPPAIVTSALTDFGNVLVGSSSASQTFTVSGTDLTGFPANITVGYPGAAFEVSLDGTTWSATIAIPYTSSTFGPVTVYVRFTPQTAGFINDNIVITGGGISTPVLVSVSGTGIAPGTPSLSATTLSDFGQLCVNTTSPAASFSLSGSDLNTSDVSVGPLDGFTFSTTSTGTYTATLVITQPGGTFNQDVWVKFSPTLVQSYNGNIPVNGGGISSAISVAASGAGINTTATVVTGNASNITMNSATLEGQITANGCSSVTAYGFEYSTTSGFTSGTVAASTNLSATNFSADISGLTPATTYYYKAFATNDGGTVYGAERSFTTLAPPPATMTATSLTGFGDVCVNQNAGPNSFTLTGTDLTAADVVIGPFNGYTFSTTSTGTFEPAISITQGGGSFSQEIFVMFSPDAAGSFSGNIPVSGGGLATPLQVAVTGSGITSGATVNTTDSLVVNHHTAILSGAINTAGCTSSVSEVGIEYGTIAGLPAGFTNKVSATLGTDNTFSVQLNNLVVGTRYYFRAYAVNAGVNIYGEEKSFRTPDLASGLVVYGNPVAAGSIVHYSIANMPNGHYSARLYNMLGQIVFQRDVISQVGFLDEKFTLPSTLPAGVYNFEIVNQKFRTNTPLLVR